MPAPTIFFEDGARLCIYTDGSSTDRKNNEEQRQGYGWVAVNAPRAMEQARVVSMDKVSRKSTSR